MGAPQPRATPYQAGRFFGQIPGAVGRGLTAVGRAPYRAAGALVGGAARALDDFDQRVLTPMSHGFAGVDEDLSTPSPALPTTRRPAQPDPLGRPDYMDPLAFEALSGRVPGQALRDLDPAPAPAPAAPAPEPTGTVAGHLRPGQMVMSGGMRPLPQSKLMDETVFRSLAPEEREAYARSTAQMQTLRKGEQESLPLQDRANAMGAAKDIEDYDQQTREPGRVTNKLALDALEWKHPVSQAKRQYGLDESYQRYGVPQQIRGQYDLYRQQLINQGMDERTAAEQAGQLQREQEQTRQTEITAGASTRSAAMQALQRTKTGQMSSPLYGAGMPDPGIDTYEDDFYNAAFGNNATGASVGESPEQVAEMLKQMPEYAAIGSPQAQAQYLRDLEQAGHLTLTETERQRLYSALGLPVR